MAGMGVDLGRPRIASAARQIAAFETDARPRTRCDERPRKGGAMRRHNHVIVVLALLGLTSAVDAPLATADGHQRHALKFRAKDTGTFTVSPTSDPNVIRTTDVGSGHARHLGRYSFTASELVNTDTSKISDGSFTITFKRGGTLSGTYTGKATFTSATTLTYRVSGPITGGSDRFAGATGFLIWKGGADLAQGTLFDRIKGKVKIHRQCD
jgi:hypothetical protein